MRKEVFVLDDNKIKSLTSEEIVCDIIDRFEKSKKDDIIIIGIGTDKDTMDCLGCLVGTLATTKCENIKVYGTLQEPIHALNIDKRIGSILETHKNSFIVGIDACLGSEEDYMKVIYKDKPIRPGAGIGKNLINVGDVSLVCVLGNSSSSFIFPSNSSRLFNTWIGAEFISEILSTIDNHF